MIRNLPLRAAAFMFALSTSARADTPPPSHLHWIISQSSVNALEKKMLPGALQTKLDNPNIYEICNQPKKTDPLPHAKHIKFYRDEKAIVSDLADGELAHFDGALYDDEAYKEPGNTTPDDQMANPLPYVQDAAKALHAAGKTFLFTIGAKVGPEGAFWTKTLPSVSPYPDIIDFQTQAAEGTPRFAKQVAHYSSVYRKNGGHLMLVGLAVSPKGEYKSSADILRAYHEALANVPPVDGFWLNMAVKSPSCTGCSSKLDATPGAEFLQSTHE